MKLIRNCSEKMGMMMLAVMFAVAPTMLWAQQNAAGPDANVPKNVKVLEERYDHKGNIVRTIQYSQGLMRVTETIVMAKPVSVGFKKPINPDTLIKDSVVVFVNKSKYTLQVFYRRQPIRSYRAVFGPRPLQDKLMEGDRCTPEGWFRITSKNPTSKYHKFLQISYPNDSSYARFNKLKAAGVLPSTARIGGSVGIHGIWSGGDNLIELGVGWTDGCVALRNQDVEELYSLVGVGTKVFITK
jgi:murein L,D-transpeptidase YafK